jgi:hypothetical protein
MSDEADPEKAHSLHAAGTDNPFLQLFLGVVIPTVLYILWGVMELTQIPVAP